MIIRQDRSAPLTAKDSPSLRSLQDGIHCACRESVAGLDDKPLDPATARILMSSIRIIVGSGRTKIGE